MDFLPRSLGTRPRLACEVRAEGVVAARAEDAFAVLSAVARVPLADQIVIPRLHADDDPSAPAGVGGDAAGRAAIVAALRKALEAVALRSREVASFCWTSTSFPPSPSRRCPSSASASRNFFPSTRTTPL